MSETPTKQLLGNKAKQAVLKGVNAVYDAVKLTLGPEGKNALMYRTYGRSPRITNDGVTISECIEPKDEFENLAAGAFKEASKRTNERAGDGTTGTIVIGGKLMNEIFSKINTDTAVAGKSADSGVMSLRKEMIELGTKVEEAIIASAKKITKVEDLYKIATVSVENPVIGKIIADMVWEVGLDGFVDTIEGYKTEIETELIKGMRFPAKVPAKVFVNNKDRFEMIATDCPVILTNFAIESPKTFVDIMDKFHLAKMIFIAPSFSDAVLTSMALSYKNGTISYPVKVPALRTEQFEDIAVACGAKFIDKNAGMQLERITPADFGFFERLIVKDVDAREDAVATGGKGDKDKIAERVKTLRAQMLETKQEIHKKLLERRIASISSAVGVIKVGAVSQAEGLYLLKKIEDAVYACRAALEEGYVEGGGLCLKKIAEAMGENILTSALNAPYEQIQSNAGATKEHPFKIGKDIIDPAKVVRLSVGHAISVVAVLSTVEVLVAEIKDKAPAEGYSEIARSIRWYVRLWAKQQNLISENENQAIKEQEEINENNILHDEMGV